MQRSLRERLRESLANGLQAGAPPSYADTLAHLFESDAELRVELAALVLSAFVTGQLSRGLFALAQNEAVARSLTDVGTRLEHRVGGGGPVNAVALLNALAPAVRRVCRISGRSGPLGTGFLIGPRSVLTNYHVVHHYLRSTDGLLCGFDCWASSRPDATTRTVKSVGARRPPPVSELAGAPTDPYPLDYAVLELEDAVGVERGFYALADAAKPINGAKVVVVGHPSGTALSVSSTLERGLQQGTDPNRIFYDADTELGSSGSLCLVLEGERFVPIALHRGAAAAHLRNNFGVPLIRILDDLGRQGVQPSTAPQSDADAEEEIMPDLGADPARLARVLLALPEALSALDVNTNESREACRQVAAALRSTWRREWSAPARLVWELDASQDIVVPSHEPDGNGATAPAAAAAEPAGDPLRELPNLGVVDTRHFTDAVQLALARRFSSPADAIRLVALTANRLRAVDCRSKPLEMAELPDPQAGIKDFWLAALTLSGTRGPQVVAALIEPVVGAHREVDSLWERLKRGTADYED